MPEYQQTIAPPPFERPPATVRPARRTSPLARFIISIARPAWAWRLELASAAAVLAAWGALASYLGRIGATIALAFLALSVVLLPSDWQEPFRRNFYRAHVRRRFGLAVRHAGLATHNDRVPRVLRMEEVPAGELLTVRVPARSIGWGEQLDIRCIGTNPDNLTPPSAEAIAAYIAKYATKATEGFGPALDRRLTARDLEHLDVNEHIAELVRTCWRLGAEASLASLQLRKWAHMLRFRGHWSSKSRRYSTTFTALRRARIEHATRGRLDPWGRPAAEGATVALPDWRYAGRVTATWPMHGSRHPPPPALAKSAGSPARSWRPDFIHNLTREEACEGTPMEKLLLTAEEAAAVLGIGRTKLYELLGAGVIESVRIDGCRRVPREAVEEFVARLRSKEAA